MNSSITVEELAGIMGYIDRCMDRFQERTDLIMIQRYSPTVAKLVIRPNIGRPFVYAELKYWVDTKGYSDDWDSILDETTHLTPQQKEEVYTHEILDDTRITPEVRFFILEDICISESDGYRIAAHLKKAGLPVDYRLETSELDEDTCVKCIDMQESALARFALSLHGKVSRRIYYTQGDYTFGIWLREENMQERDQVQGVLRPDTKYWPFDLQITKKNRKGYCGRGFKLKQLASQEFASFNDTLQSLVVEFVVDANTLLSGKEVPILLTKTIITPQEWEKEFDEESSSAREHFPKALYALEHALNAVKSNDVGGMCKSLSILDDFVYAAICASCTGPTPNPTYKAYQTLLFVTGYLGGLAIRNGIPTDEQEQNAEILKRNYLIRFYGLLIDKRNPFTGNLFLQDWGDAIKYYWSLVTLGIDKGLKNELDHKIDQVFCSDPKIIRVRHYQEIVS